MSKFVARWKEYFGSMTDTDSCARDELVAAGQLSTVRVNRSSPVIMQNSTLSQNRVLL